MIIPHHPVERKKKRSEKDSKRENTCNDIRRKNNAENIFTGSKAMLSLENKCSEHNKEKLKKRTSQIKTKGNKTKKYVFVVFFSPNAFDHFLHSFIYLIID